MKLHNKNGKFTRFAFDRGYVEVKGNFQLYRDSYSAYRIMGITSDSKLICEWAPDLRTARKMLNSFARLHPSN